MSRERRCSWILALLFVATASNAIDRQTLSVLSPTLRSDLGLTEGDYANVVTAFLISYMIMYSVSGRLTDRLGVRPMLSLSLAWWSIASMLTALARGAFSLAASGRFSTRGDVSCVRDHLPDAGLGDQYCHSCFRGLARRRDCHRNGNDGHRRKFGRRVVRAVSRRTDRARRLSRGVSDRGCAVSARRYRIDRVDSIGSASGLPGPKYFSMTSGSVPLRFTILMPRCAAAQ